MMASGCWEVALLTFFWIGFCSLCARWFALRCARLEGGFVVVTAADDDDGSSSCDIISDVHDGGILLLL